MRYIDTGQRDSNQALGTWMKSLDPSSVLELRFQTGFFGIQGVALLQPVFESLRRIDGVTHCLVGSNDSGTGGDDVCALVEMLGMPRTGAMLKVCAFNNGYFHPKVIHVRHIGGRQTAYVGSANLTASGVLGQHIEAGILFDTEEGDPAGELEKIAAAVDEWFHPERSDCFQVDGCADVDELVMRGVLAKVTGSDETSARSRKSSQREATALPSLKPLLILPSTKKTQAKIPGTSATSMAITSSSSAGGVKDEPDGDFFMMELPKNRPGGKSYQADIGKAAFTDFFGGKIGGHTEVRINAIASDGKGKVSKERSLVDVKSKNYRLEIAFPAAYPANGRPIVIFRRLGPTEFDSLLLLPDDHDYSLAVAALSSVASPVLGNKMRRVILAGEKLKLAWPGCPLL